MKWQWLAGGLALVLGACGGDDGDGTSVSDYHFVALSAVPNGEDYNSLVGFYDTLEPGAPLQQSKEYPGFNQMLHTPQRPGAFFISFEESASIQRFDYVDGQVVDGPTMGFTNLGVRAPYGYETVYDAPLAYSVITSGAQLVVWNIDTMTIVRSIPIPGLPRAGYTSVNPSAVVLRDGKVFFAQNYTDFPTGNTLSLTALVSIDVANGDVVKIEEDNRCSGVRNLLQTADGTLYGATDGFFAVRKRLFGANAGTEPCFLRVLPGQTKFDPGYILPSRQLFDSAIVGDFTLTADGTEVLINGYDEQVAPIAANAAYVDVANAAGWRLLRAPLAAITERSGARAQPVAGLALGARAALRPNVGTTSYAPVRMAGNVSTQIFELTAAGAEPGPVITGGLQSLDSFDER